MTDGEIQKMQQEAVRRAQEMQRRSAMYRRSEAASQSEQSVPVPDPSAATASAEAVSRPVQTPAPSVQEHGSAGGWFDLLMKDKEKTLIIGLLLVLMDEKTDSSLLLALVYLLL